MDVWGITNPAGLAAPRVTEKLKTQELMGKRSNRRRPGGTGKRGLEAAYRPTKTMVFHKSLKQNAALGKAPVRRVVTRNNHVFAALYALLKLERLKIKRRLRHFALRAHLYRKTIRAAHDEPQVLKAAQHQLLISRKTQLQLAQSSRLQSIRSSSKR